MLLQAVVAAEPLEVLIVESVGELLGMELPLGVSLGREEGKELRDGFALG